MENKHRPRIDTTRPEPKTRRGRATRDEILAAARKLAGKSWVHETPFTELAEAAGVARASLLHAYPHWRDVCYDLFIKETERLDAAYELAVSLKRVRTVDRVYAFLVVLLDEAEKTGRLYPNLRSAMFTWHGEWHDDVAPDGPSTPELLGRYALYDLSDQYAGVEVLLRIPPDPTLKDNEFGPQAIGECLVNLAFDLAAGSPSYWADFDERRQTLRKTIEVIAAGIAQTAGRKRKPKAR